jgi:hypothetical protein
MLDFDYHPNLDLEVKSRLDSKVVVFKSNPIYMYW